MALENLISYGVIESVQNLKLNLRDPPSNQDHLVALVPCVTGKIEIRNLQPLDSKDEPYNVTTLLDAVNCRELYMCIERLNQEETEALVRAMTSRVKILSLSWEFHMDFDAFRMYKGDGMCKEVHISNYSYQGNLRIFNYSEYRLSSLLDSVTCKELHLWNETKNLDKVDTEALVRAMTSRVEIVHLGGKNGDYKDTVSLDFDTLTKYKGDGKCREVHCNHVCIGWSEVDDIFGRDYDEEYDELGRGLYITTDEYGYFHDKKDKWMDVESAETWAKQMNWDLKVINQDGEYLLSRK